MTKQQLQKELLEKVKPGTKPSHLKRSKSADEIAPASVPVTEPSRRKSVGPVINQPSLTQQLTKAQNEISTLGLQVEIQSRELTEFQAENSHLKAQAEIKQQDLEDLRKQLEEKSSQLALAQNDLDASLQARHQSLKDWKQEHSQRIQAQTELNETVEESSEELINQDQLVTNLRTQIIKLKQQKQSLQQDLNLSQRLIELRSESPFNPANFNHSLTYLQYALYALFTIWFCLILKGKKN